MKTLMEAYGKQRFIILI